MKGEPRGDDKYDGREGAEELARYWEPRLRDDLRGTTHYEGCEFDHRACALWYLARYLLLPEGEPHV